MNKRSKKRLREKIAKEKQERDKLRPEGRPGPVNEPRELRGFMPKPEKKRG